MSKSSRRWLKEHEEDAYVKQARREGYRSRAVYKLAELDERDRLFHPGMRVVDLGAAPGGWSQWVHRRLNGRVDIIALDILPMPALPGVAFMQGDFTEQTVLDQLISHLKGQKTDLVMSDMAPNISGMKSVDQPRVMYLAELARDFALNFVAPDGTFLSKVFQGEGFDAFVKDLRAHFNKVMIRKPKASRPRSGEVYVLARGFRV